MRLITDGVEFGDFLELTAHSGVTVTTEDKRSGVYSYRFGGGSHYITYEITPSAEVYIRVPVDFFTIRSSPYGWKVYLLKGATIVGSVGHNGQNSRFEVWSGDYGSTKLISSINTFANLNTWYMLELHFKIHNSTGVAELKIDGISQGSFTGNTQIGSDTEIDGIKITANDSNEDYCYIDDVAVNNTDDSDGLGDISWCGEGKIEALSPNGNGTVNQYTGSDGNSTDNYLLVDEVPPSSADYVENAVAGEQDMYTLTDFTGTGKTILRVWTGARALDTVPESAQMKLGLRTGENNYVSPAIALLSSYKSIKGSWYKNNPQTTVAWTDSDLDAIELVLETV